MIVTGYSGSLTLPPSLVAEPKLPYVLGGKATLPDDSEVGFSVYRVTAMWGSKSRHVEADAVGSTPPVGMTVLGDHDLSIQVRDGGRVVIQTGGCGPSRRQT